MKAILAINSGSSSLKFRLASMDGERLFSGTATRLGTDGAKWSWRVGSQSSEEKLPSAKHGEVVNAIAAMISKELSQIEVSAVGHRIVHGGMNFADSMIIQGQVFADIKALEPLAPLHQPAGIMGVELAMRAFPNAVQVAVFDTGFHGDKPWINDAYALSDKHYQAGIRRYGFHGISCQSVMRKLETNDEDIKAKRIVIAHLGNGCSITAVKDGKSQANSMGFSALDGVAMGTRPGHIDAGVLIHWMRMGKTMDEIERELYHASGLLGLSGISNDVRDLMASSDPKASSAITYFKARIAEEISRMATVMSGVDLVVFCGGIGENSREIRDDILAQIAFLSPNGAMASQVITTDEEGEIILQAKALL